MSGTPRAVTDATTRENVGTALVSAAQRRVWCQEQLTADAARFTVGSGWWLQGELNASRLETAIDELVAQHELFRSRFVVGDEGMRAVVQNAGPRLSVSDLTLHPLHRRRTVLEEKIQSRLDTGIRAAGDELFEVSLYRIEERSHVLFAAAHRMIWDEWSFQIFLQELLRLYAEDRAPGLATLGTNPAGGNAPSGDASARSESQMAPRQYAEHVSENERRFQVDGSAVLGYWAAQLASPLPALDLSTGKTRPRQFTGRAIRETRAIAERTLANISALAVEFGATLDAVFLAMFFVALKRYSGQEDIIVGLEVSGRRGPGDDRVLGPVGRVLPIRIAMSGNPSFGELLDAVQKRVEAAQRYDTIGVEALLDLVKEHDTSRTPIFQAAFRFESLDDEPAIEDLRLTPLELFARTCATDVSLCVALRGDRATCRLDFYEEVFDSAFARNFGESLIRLCESANRMSVESIDSVCVISDADSRLRRLINATSRTWKYSSVVEMLEERLAVETNKPAVLTTDAAMSYAELKDCVACIESALRRLGVGRGAIVGVCMPRSPVLVASLIAILRAGAAYLPLDPAHPSDRNRYMCQNAGALCVVTDDAEHRRARDFGVGCLNVEALRPAEEMPLDAMAVGGFDPAYVIYTSGSSGRPKGVIVPHSALANLVQSMAVRPGMHANDRVLALATVTFDIHVLELLAPIAFGATVVLLRSDESGNGSLLAKVISDHRVSLMQATPSTWQLLRQSNWSGEKRMRALVGGEPIGQATADWLADRAGEVWNVYGPTETTVWSTCGRILGGQPPFIGLPLHNTTVHVLNGKLQAMPAGVVGELYIGGAGVALGYVSDEEATRRRFIEVDLGFGRERVYRTGDLVRQHRDGRLEYVGRNDRQVKLRGFRIELGEIERAIEEIQGVARAVAVIEEWNGEDKRLVAYYESNVAPKIFPTEVRKILRKRLPGYMLPQHVALLERIPVTQRGKIDHGSLPRHVEDRSSRIQNAPATNTERQLATIWRRLLGNHGVDRHDNFFDLGGHSLLAARLYEEVKRCFGVELNLRDVLLDDIAALSRKIDDAGGSQPQNHE